MKLIALAGPAGCGKDTVGAYLAYVHHAYRYSFAQPLKDALNVMLDLDRLDWSTHLKEQTLPWLGVSPRVLAQTLGTEWGRQIIRDDIWLIVAGRRLEKINRKLVVITDCRFGNEADWVRDRGGQVWHIRGRRKEGVAAHVSEAGVTAVEGDIEIDNSGDLSRLHQQIDAQLEPVA